MRKLDKKFFEEMVKNKDLVEKILHWDHLHKKSRFNTDDGIRRAAMGERSNRYDYLWKVSIPMTVLGGLQCEK